MILNEDLFDFYAVPQTTVLEIPIVDVQDELTIDDIEQEFPATPEENGVAMSLSSTISDMWQKVNDYNSLIATVDSSDVEAGEDIVAILKDITDDELKNIGKLQSALEQVSPNVSNLDVGEEEADMKLTESLSEDDVLKKHGFSEDGVTYVFMGDTYAKKDQIKELGGKFDKVLGWHIDHEEPGFFYMKVYLDDVADGVSTSGWGDIIYKDDAQNKIASLKYKRHKQLSGEKPSEYVGSVGDRYSDIVTLEKISGYEYNPPYSYNSTWINIYTFSDVDGNQIVWKTSKDIEGAKEGRKFTISGIIKDHSTFRGVPQTVLTRCKVILESLGRGICNMGSVLTESISSSTSKKRKELAEALGRDSISSADEHYIYDDWGAFYNDPEAYEDSPVVDILNFALDNTKSGYSDSEDDEDFEDEDFDMEDQVIIDDDFIKDSLSEDVQPKEKKSYRLGTIRYNANEGRKKRIDYYKKLANVDSDVPLTEDMLKEWAVNRVACFTNTTPERVREELIGNRWSEFEEE